MDQLFGAYVDGLSDIPEVTLAGIFDDALTPATIMNANMDEPSGTSIITRISCGGNGAPGHCRTRNFGSGLLLRGS